MKKILAMALALAMLLSMATFSAVAADNANVTSTGGVYTFTSDANGKVKIGDVEYIVIESASTLKAALSANNAGKNFILANDIDIGAYGSTDANTWKNVLTLTEGTVFEGNGFALTNITFTSNVNVFNGFFNLTASETADDAVIVRNLTIGSENDLVEAGYGVIDNDVKANTSWYNVAVYTSLLKVDGNSAAFLNGSLANNTTHSFTDCYAYEVSTDRASTVVGNTAAAFVARSQSGNILTFSNCVADGEFGAVNICGAFVGKNQGNVTIENCVNNAKLSITTASSNNAVGGMVGTNESGASVTIEGCYNNADILAPNVTDGQGGGFVGCNKATTSIETSQNSGNITGFKIGGLVGVSNNGTNVTVTNCINLGNIGDSTSNQAAGLVCGGGVVAEISGSLNAGTITSGTWAVGLIYKGDATSTVKNSVNIGVISGKSAHSCQVVGNVAATVTNTHAFGSGTTNYAYTDLNSKSTGNLYITASTHATGATVATVDTAYTTLKGMTAYRYFAFEKGTDSITLPAVSVVAAQLGTSADKVRVLGVTDSLGYKGIGFKYTVTSGGSAKTGTYYCDYVYSSVIADTGAEGLVQVEARECGGAYIYALTFNFNTITIEGCTIEVQAVVLDKGVNTATGTVARYTVSGGALTLAS